MISIENRLQKQPFINFKDQPRPPVCDQSEWRFLLFLRNARKNAIDLPIEEVTVRRVDDASKEYSLPAVRKGRMYGLRTYLTAPIDETDLLWIAAPGYMLEGAYPIQIHPTTRYLLRPIISNPDIATLHKLTGIFKLPQKEAEELEAMIENIGFRSLIQSYLPGSAGL